MKKICIIISLTVLLVFMLAGSALGVELSGEYLDVILTLNDEGTLYIRPAEVESAHLPDFLPNTFPKQLVKSMIFEGNLIVSENGVYSFFSDYPNLETIDFTGLDLSNVKTMYRAFDEFPSLKEVDFSGINLSNVTSMRWMFKDCPSLQKVNFMNANLSKVDDMREMFENCPSLQEVDFSFARTDSLELMDHMFLNCSALTSFDFSKCDTRKVRDMSYMFEGCSSLSEVNLYIPTPEINMSGMFKNCTSLKELDLSNINITNANLTSLCQGCSKLKTVKLCTESASGDVSMIAEYMGYMFADCTKLENVMLGNIGAYHMSNIFKNCKSLKTVDLSRLDTHFSDTFDSMFQDCKNLESVDLSTFDTRNLVNCTNMFRNCTSLREVDFSNWDTSKVGSFRAMFYNCKSLEKLDLSSFHTDSNAEYIYLIDFLARCSSLKELDISNFNTSNSTCLDDFIPEHLEKIKIGSNVTFKVDSPRGFSFGRGTWIREEDGKKYSAVEICNKSLTGDAAGTYTKVSDTSNELYADFPVTYKIGEVQKDKVEFSTTNDEIFTLVDDKQKGVLAKLSIEMHNESYDTNKFFMHIDEVLDGKVELLFRNIVSDADNNLYNLKVTFSDISFYGVIDSPFELKYHNFVKWTDDRIAIRSFQYDSIEDFNEETRSNIPGLSIKYKVEMEVLNGSGESVDGSYIFCMNDLDTHSAMDKESAYKSYDERYGFGVYSEGVNLVEGFDLDTLKVAENTSLIYGNAEDFSNLIYSTDGVISYEEWLQSKIDYYKLLVEDSGEGHKQYEQETMGNDDPPSYELWLSWMENLLDYYENNPEETYNEYTNDCGRTHELHDQAKNAIEGFRLTGTRPDVSSEFSEFIVQADAKKTVFEWTAGVAGGTPMFSYYQPQIVDVILQNTSGELLSGGTLELYRGDEKVKEWDTTNEGPETVFLVPGQYTLKEVVTPDSYITAEDIDFFVDLEYRITRDNEEVEQIIMINEQDATQPPENTYRIEVVWPDENYVYSGTPKTPVPTKVEIVTLNPSGEEIDRTEVLLEEYSIEYENNINASISGDPTTPPTAKLTYSGDKLQYETEKTFVIERVPLTVTANDKTKRVGEENPDLTNEYTTSGEVNNEVPVFEGIPTTTATKESPKGVYPIAINGILEPKAEGTFNPNNYEITYIDGKLVVTSGNGSGRTSSSNTPKDDEKEIDVDLFLSNGVIRDRKGNDNYYLLGEDVIYNLDYENVKDAFTNTYKLTLEFTLECQIIDADGGEINGNVITWTIRGGMTKDEIGRKTVKVKYTKFSPNNSKGWEDVYPISTISIEDKQYDESSVHNIIYTLESKLESRHVPFMYGDYGTDLFRPDAVINRAESALVLTRIFEIDTSNVQVKGNEFTDLQDTYPEAQRAIVKSAELGLITGYEDGSYKPLQKIKKAEFMTIIARFVEYKSAQENIKGMDIKEIHNDSMLYKRTGHWADKYILLLDRLNMTPESINTQEELNKYLGRAEAAQLCNKYLLRAPVKDDGNIKLKFPDVYNTHELFGDIVEATRPAHDDFRLTEDAYEVFK